MNLQDETGTTIRRARPDTTPKEAALDIDAVVRAGYRSRHRGFAAVGAAATAGVAAIAAVLALSLGGPGPLDDHVAPLPAGDPFGFDPAQAGYPDQAGEDRDPVRTELDLAVRSTFGGLAVDSGFLDGADLDYEAPTEEAVTAAMEEWDIGYDEALSELGYQNLPLQAMPWNAPGNGGQVYLRGYIARDGDEEALQSSFAITALQPGGWTAEPGPIGDVAFPQHLISDEASWTDQAPEFTKDALEDGRTLLIADHGCALEAAVVYPNGSALRSSWDLDCSGQGRTMDVEDLRAAMLAMPQFEYDTSELRPVDDLLEIPRGWEWDEEWEDAASADSLATFDQVTGAMNTAGHDVELLASQPSQGYSETDLVRRAYSADYHMPFTDDAGDQVYFSVVYYLPGGWLPGLAPEGTNSEPYLLNCDSEKDDVCEETEVDGRTVATRTFGIGDNHSYWVMVYDPAGWAVAFETSFEGAVEGYAFKDIIELAASLPAPVYDPAEYERD